MLSRCLLVLCAMLGIASAQPVASVQPAPAACFPECRAGFTCSRGTCVAACNPACAINELCSPEGTCVSACNPACGAGETCGASGQCIAQPMVAAPATPRGPAADPGWARGAAVFGYVSAGVIAGLALGVIFTNFPDAEDVSRITGGVAISYAAVSIPLVAIGGGSARHHPEVNGVLGLRIAGWIGYGLTLADATALLVLSFDHPIDNWHVASVGLLGSTTAAAFAIDATISASQANSVRAKTGGLTLHPGFGIARTSAREQVPLLTLQGTF